MELFCRCEDGKHAKIALKFYSLPNRHEIFRNCGIQICLFVARAKNTLQGNQIDDLLITNILINDIICSIPNEMIERERKSEKCELFHSGFNAAQVFRRNLLSWVVGINGDKVESWIRHFALWNHKINFAFAENYFWFFIFS